MEQFLNFALFGSFAWALAFFILLFIVLMVSEGVEHGGVAFLGLACFLLINYYWGNIPVQKLITWQNVLGYLGIGFIFAIIRIYFYGRKLGSEGETIKDAEIKEHVFRWWFIWPASLIYWCFSSLLIEAYNLVYDKFESTFKYFLNLGINSKAKNKKNGNITKIS